MKKKKQVILTLLFITLAIECVYLHVKKNKTDGFEDKNLVNTIKKEDTLSFMLETSYGSGEYKEGTSTKWPAPSDGYLFNATLSNCQNGGELDWDDTNNVITMAGNMSDKCYVYFDAVQKAVINEITTSDITATSITITIDSTKGTFDISKYYYSIDDGTTWNESTSNVISISGLTKGTEYTIKTCVQDVKGINSEYKSVSVSTLSLITFTIQNITYYAEPGMTWNEWLDSDYNTSIWEYLGRKGCYITNGGATTVADSNGNVITDPSIMIIENYLYTAVGC